MITDASEIELFYVDDNPDDIFLLRYMAGQQQAAPKISNFSSGEEVMGELLRRSSEGLVMPDAIVVDLYLPIVDGCELISRLREQPELSGMRMFACSGSVDDEDRLRAIRAGADFFVEKPVDLVELLNKF